MSTIRDDLSKEELELHQIMLSRTRLKSSMRTSTLMAGFALVRAHTAVGLWSHPSNGIDPAGLVWMSTNIAK